MAGRLASAIRSLMFTTSPTADSTSEALLYPKTDGWYEKIPGSSERKLGASSGSLMLSPSILLNYTSAASAQVPASTWTLAAAGNVASVGSDITYDAANAVTTINRSGYYRVGFQLGIGAANIARMIGAIVVGSNPDVNVLVRDEDGGSNGAYPFIGANNTVYLTAGSQIRWYVWVSTATTFYERRFSIESVGPVEVQNNFNTQATYVYFKGVTTPNNAYTYQANASMDFGTRVDPFNLWQTGSKTVRIPYNGRYRVSVGWKEDAADANATPMRITRNGNIVYWSQNPAQQAYSGGYISNVFELLAGDLIASNPQAQFGVQPDGAGVENTYLIVESVGHIELQSSGPITPTYGAGYLAYAGFEAPTLQLDGKYVSAQGLVQRTSGSNGGAGNNVIVVPLGMRPLGTLLLDALSTSPAGDNIPIRFNLDSSGNFYPSPQSINAGGYVNLTNLRWRVP